MKGVGDRYPVSMIDAESVTQRVVTVARTAGPMGAGGFFCLVGQIFQREF